MGLTKREALNSLSEGSHRRILKTEVAREIAAPFGIEVESRTFRVGEEDVLWGEALEFEGVPAYSLACDIAASMGLKEWLNYVGRGFQMRAAIEEVGSVLENEDAER